MFRVELTESAAEQFDRIPGTGRQKLAAHIDALQDDPFPVTSSQFDSHIGLFRLYIRPYYVFYFVEFDMRYILVVKFATISGDI